MATNSKKIRMEDFNFELFTGKKGKYSVTVSVSKPGVLSFSAGMAHKYELSQYKGAQLYFDKAKKTIAIKFITDEAQSMFTLKNRDENKGSFVACKSFVTANEIEEYFGKRYTPVEMEHSELGKLMIISLSDSKN